MSSLREKGFTLIELLVVISIIGLLSSVVLASVNTARDKGRVAAGKTFDGHTYQVFGAEAVGIWNFDEGTLPAKDVSGFGNDFTVNSGVTWGGSSNSFKGNSIVTSATSLLSAAGFNTGSWDGKSGSISFWMNPTSTSGRGWIFNLGNVFYFQNKTFSGNNIFEFQYASPGFVSATSNETDLSPYLNKWTHIVVSWSTPQSTINFYVNGKLIASKPSEGTFAKPGNSLTIGSASSGAFIGSLDEVRVYTQAIQTAQVEQLYVEGLPAHIFAEN